MTKPSTARPRKAAPTSPKPPKAKAVPKPLEVAYDGTPATRVRAIKTGHNEFSVVEEIFTAAPSSTKVLATKVSGSSAMYRCRLRLEELLGTNRLGGTGLE